MTTVEMFQNLKEWMDQTLPWLGTDGAANALPNPYTQLLDMLRRAAKENRASDVWDLVNELEELSNRAGDTREQGEILINCAKVAVDLENLKSALYFFEGAKSKFTGYPHRHAVVLWMMGCVHWVMKQKVDGISTWQTAIRLFEDRQLSVQVDSEIAKWYIEKLKKMRETLETAIASSQLPSWNSSAAPDPAQSEIADASEQADAGQSFFEGDSLLWVSTQVSESIPAGGFGPTGFDPDPLGFLEISEVVIEEQPYEVVSVRGSSARRNLVDINSRWRYHTVCVTGTSMNAAKPVPIVDGDFVFIRVQPDAEDNDIVVVGILGLDSRATVKRLRQRNGKRQFVPETTDPIHSEIDWEKEYDEFDEEIQILGVVEAIFRKKDS